VHCVHREQNQLLCPDTAVESIWYFTMQLYTDIVHELVNAKLPLSHLKLHFPDFSIKRQSRLAFDYLIILNHRILYYKVL